MAAPSELSPSSDASLRRLLERRPACLVRVRLDGVLLACNQAALALLGTEGRAVLNSSLADRLLPPGNTQWQEFVARCSAEGAASFNGHLVIGDQNARPVIVQGVPLTDHPDGVESLLLHLREQPQTQRLDHESAAMVRQPVGDQNERVSAEPLQLGVLADDDQAERARLTEMLDAQSADRQRREARIAQLEKKLEQSRLILGQKEREFGRDVAMLKSTLAAAHAARATAAGDAKRDLEALQLRLQAATAEQQRLQGLVAQHESERERLAADRQAAVDTLQQSLAELRAQAAQASAEHARLAGQVETAERELHSQRAEHERARHGLVAEHHRALAELETAKREEVDALNQRVHAATAEHARLQALVEAAAVDRDRVAADHRAAVDTLQQSLARVREAAALQSEQFREALAEAQSGLTRSLDEQSRVASRVEAAERALELQRAEHERAHDRLVAEHRQALADVETSKRETIDDLRSEHSQTLADQRRLAALLEEHERQRDTLIAEHHRVLAGMESGTRDALAELRTQLSQALTEQRRLASHAGDQELELKRLRAAHQATLTDLETRHRGALTALRAELIEAAQRAEHHERERNRMSGEHNRALADLLSANDAAAAELRSKLSEALAEQQRLTTLLEQHDVERERLAAEHRRTIADLQTSKQNAVAECERVLTEVQQALLVRDASRRLEVERRLVDGIDEAPQIKIDGQRLATLQRGLTTAFSQVQAVLKGEPAPTQPFAAEQPAPERPAIQTIDKAMPATTDDPLLADADLSSEPFDDLDDAFVQQLLEGVRATRAPGTSTDAESVLATRAASGMSTATTDDQTADDLFDTHDDTFVRRLMETPEPLPPSSAKDS